MRLETRALTATDILNYAQVSVQTQFAATFAGALSKCLLFILTSNPVNGAGIEYEQSFANKRNMEKASYYQKSLKQDTQLKINFDPVEIRLDYLFAAR